MLLIRQAVSVSVQLMLICFWFKKITNCTQISTYGLNGIKRVTLYPNFYKHIRKGPSTHLKWRSTFLCCGVKEKKCTRATWIWLWQIWCSMLSWGRPTCTSAPEDLCNRPASTAQYCHKWCCSHLKSFLLKCSFKACMLMSLSSSNGAQALVE